jgi:hypothetical protein
MGLLVMAIVLFVLSAFFYSYEAASLASYPYRGYAITFVGFGSFLMFAASVSYSKRSKNLGHKNY